MNRRESTTENKLEISIGGEKTGSFLERPFAEPFSPAEWLLALPSLLHSWAEQTLTYYIRCLPGLKEQYLLVAHMIMKTLASACLLLEIRWTTGRRHADKMRTCTHSLPTFLAAPSNFLSLPSTQFLWNFFFWRRLTVHPWLLASCWPWCGWSLTALRRVACK